MFDRSKSSITQKWWNVIAIVILIVVAGSMRVAATDFTRAIGENSDAAAYHFAAKNLIKYGMLTNDRLGEMYSGAVSAEPSLTIMPGFPIFLAALYLIKDSIQFVFCVQIVLSILTVVLIYLILIEIQVDGKISFVATLLAASYPAFIYNLDILLTETLFTTLLTAGIWSFIKYYHNYKKISWLITSVILVVCAGLVRAQALPLVLVEIFFVVYSECSNRTKFLHSSIIVIIVCLGLLPMCMRNWITFHELRVLAMTGENPKIWGAEPYFLNMASTEGKTLTELIQTNFRVNPEGFIKWRIFGFLKYMWYDFWDENLVHPIRWMKALRMIHYIVVIPALLAIPVLVKKATKSVLFLACIPIAFTVMAMPYHGLPRYVFPSVPMLFVVWGYLINSLTKRFRQDCLKGNNFKTTAALVDRAFRYIYIVGATVFSLLLAYSVFVFAWQECTEMSQFFLTREYGIKIQDVDILNIVDDIALSNENEWTISNADRLQANTYRGVWDAIPILNVSVPVKNTTTGKKVISKVEMNISGGYLFDYSTVYWKSSEMSDFSEEYVYGRFARNIFENKITVYIADDVDSLLIVPAGFRGSDFSVNSIHITKYEVS